MARANWTPPSTESSPRKGSRDRRKRPYSGDHQPRSAITRIKSPAPPVSSRSHAEQSISSRDTLIEENDEQAPQNSGQMHIAIRDSRNITSFGGQDELLYTSEASPPRISVAVALDLGTNNSVMLTRVPQAHVRHPNRLPTSSQLTRRRDMRTLKAM
jgi:hypothetical protein